VKDCISGKIKVERLHLRKTRGEKGCISERSSMGKSFSLSFSSSYHFFPNLTQLNNPKKKKITNFSALQLYFILRWASLATHPNFTFPITTITITPNHPKIKTILP
jgi:hypothetical protein